MIFLTETFWTNPQYRVEVVDADDDDDDDKGTIIVGLMQKERRKMRKEGAELLTMGYVIYKVCVSAFNERYEPVCSFCLVRDDVCMSAIITCKATDNTLFEQKYFSNFTMCF